MKQNIVILTGAGISKESGINTFRDQNGLWHNVPLEEVATAQAIARDRPRVNAFYSERRRQLHDPAIQPNAAHRALALLQRSWPAEVTLVTQNVDDLHERGGSTSPIHIHGHLLEAVCLDCSKVTTWPDDILPRSVCPSCSRVGQLRPNIVLFGEVPFQLDLIGEKLKRCGLFISIGTSGNVYPAAGFVSIVKARWGRCVELNLEPSLVANEFDEHVYGPATEIVPVFVERLLAAGQA